MLIKLLQICTQCYMISVRHLKKRPYLRDRSFFFGDTMVIDRGQSMGWVHRVRRIMVWTAVIAGAATLLIITLYQFTVLDPQAGRYMSQLHTAADQLKVQCIDLADKTQKNLVETPPQTLAGVKDDERAMRSLSEQTRQELERFTAVAGMLQASPYIPLSTSAYRKGIVLKNQTAGTIDQIHEVLDEYDQLADFLVEYYKLHYQLSDELATFNSYTDLNLIIGQSERQRTIAMNIQTQTKQLSELTVPRGLEDLATRSVAIHERAAQGFSALADGLAISADSQIYAAAAQIETVTEQLDANFRAIANTLPDLPAFKHVYELPEKIDRFKF